MALSTVLAEESGFHTPPHSSWNSSCFETKRSRLVTRNTKVSNGLPAKATVSDVRTFFNPRFRTSSMSPLNSSRVGGLFRTDTRFHILSTFSDSLQSTFRQNSLVLLRCGSPYYFALP